MISELNGHKQHMHYVDFDSKNKQTIIRFAIYTVLGLLAFGVSLLVIFAARGYDVDPATGKVVRNGLVLMWSQPESVDVYVNGQLEDNTPARLPLPVDTYDLKMSKLGYRDWNKTVKVGPSEVVKLNYPRLFPNEIKPEAVATLPVVSDWLQSADQETIAVYGAAGTSNILLYNVEDINSAPKIITIPQSALVQPGEQVGKIDIHQWSADSDFLMIKHTVASRVEYVRINVVDNEFININQTLTQPVTNLQFDRSENNKMYGLIEGRLVRINIAENTISAPLIGEVADFRVAADGRVVVIQKRAQISSAIIIDKDDKLETLLSGPATTSTQIELGNFEDDDYAVVSLNPNQSKLLWLDEVEGRPRRQIATFDATANKIYPVSFTGRFAVITSGETVIVHDFEKLRVFRFKLAGLTTQSLSWFDDGHLITTTKAGSVDVVEFDGANKTSIGKGSQFKVYTDKDFNSFYSLGASSDGKVNINVSNLRP